MHFPNLVVQLTAHLGHRSYHPSYLQSGIDWDVTMWVHNCIANNKSQPRKYLILVKFKQLEFRLLSQMINCWNCYYTCETNFFLRGREMGKKQMVKRHKMVDKRTHKTGDSVHDFGHFFTTWWLFSCISYYADNKREC